MSSIEDDDGISLLDVDVVLERVYLRYYVGTGRGSTGWILALFFPISKVDDVVLVCFEGIDEEPVEVVRVGYATS